MSRLKKIDVQGTVNVDKIGDYEIVYKKMAQKKRKQSFMSVMTVS